MMRCQFSSLLLAVWLLLCILPRPEGKDVKLCGGQLEDYIHQLCNMLPAGDDSSVQGQRAKLDPATSTDAMRPSISRNAETFKMNAEPFYTQEVMRKLRKTTFKESDLNSEDVKKISRNTLGVTDVYSDFVPQLKSLDSKKHNSEKRAYAELLYICCEYGCTDEDLRQMYCRNI